MGLSVPGLCVAVVLLAPGVAIGLRPPSAPLPPSRLPGWVTAVERVGQVAVVGVLAWSRTALDRVDVVPWVVVAAVLLGYLGWFAARYLRRGRHPHGLYEPAGPVPVPLAVLPVAALLVLAASARSVPLAAAALVLAPAHVAVARDAWSQLRATRETDRAGSGGSS